MYTPHTHPPPTHPPPLPLAFPQVLSNPSARVLRILDRSGFTDKLSRDWIFVRVHDAVTYCRNHTRLALEGGPTPGPGDEGGANGAAGVGAEKVIKSWRGAGDANGSC